MDVRTEDLEKTERPGKIEGPGRTEDPESPVRVAREEVDSAVSLILTSRNVTTTTL